MLAFAPQLYLVALDGLDVAFVLEGVRSVLVLLRRINVGLIILDRVSQDVALVLLISAYDNPSMRLAVGQSRLLVVLVVLVPGADCCAIQTPNRLSQGRVRLNRGAVGGVNQLIATSVVCEQSVVDNLSVLTTQSVGGSDHVGAVQQAYSLSVGHVGERIVLLHVSGLITHCTNNHGYELSIGDCTVRLELVVANADYDAVDVAVADSGILPGALLYVREGLSANVLRNLRVASHQTSDHCAGLCTGNSVFRMILAVVLTLDNTQIGQHGDSLGVIGARRDILKHLSASEHAESACKRQYHSKNLLKILHRNISSFLISRDIPAPPLLCIHHNSLKTQSQCDTPRRNTSVILHRFRDNTLLKNPPWITQ